MTADMAASSVRSGAADSCSRASGMAAITWPPAEISSGAAVNAQLRVAAPQSPGGAVNGVSVTAAAEASA
ncbi:hypothetical protein [Mycobacterium avium]|uniref:hypothetical protein n=1 Tax=Mycobacterium avium TaxID=1764 RepID=UPI001F329522|nr:hypothetical protein [Mycobacterium avium]